MKMQLDYPFTEDFKAAYLNINKEPRRVVSLVRKDGSKTSVSYARYLMCCAKRRYLSADEHVDHIDNDKLNDVLDNLQIITQQENNAKNRSRTYLTLTCPICKREFTKELKNLNHKLKSGKNPTCSRFCGRKQGLITKNISRLQVQVL